MRHYSTCRNASLFVHESGNKATTTRMPGVVIVGFEWRGVLLDTMTPQARLCKALKA